MLTNFQTVYKRLQRMKELGGLGELTGTAAGYTKKETLQLSREKIKLTKTLGGLRDMQKIPAAVWIVDTKKEHIAVDEARKLGIPVIAVLDTNCDPDEVDFPIPGNDDAIRSAALLTRVVADAVADGLIARSGRRRGGDEKPEPGVVAGDEPLAEWERELLEEPKKAAERPPAAAEPAAGCRAADAAPGRPGRRRAAGGRRRRVIAPSRARRPRSRRLDGVPWRRTGRIRVTGTSTIHRSLNIEERAMSNFTAADVKKLRDLTGAGMMDCKKALDRGRGRLRQGRRDPARQGRQGRRQAGRPYRRQRPRRPLRQRAARAQLRDRLRRQERRLRRAGPAAGRARSTQPAPADVEALLASKLPTAAPSPTRSRSSPPRSARSWCVNRFAVLDGTGRRLPAPQEPGPAAAGRRRWSQYAGKTDEAGDADARGVAMQIAAMRPKYLTRDEVPADVVETERRIAEQTAREEGKPEAALPKIIEGRVNAFFKDFVLLEQAVGRGQQEVGQAGAGRGRHRGDPVRAVRGRPGLSRRTGRRGARGAGDVDEEAAGVRDRHRGLLVA